MLVRAVLTKVASNCDDRLVGRWQRKHMPIRDSLAEMAHGIYEILTLGQHYYRPIGAEPQDTGEAVIGPPFPLHPRQDQSLFGKRDESHPPPRALMRSTLPSQRLRAISMSF